MKKIILSICIMFLLFISGCSENSENSKNIMKKNENITCVEDDKCGHIIQEVIEMPDNTIMIYTYLWKCDILNNTHEVSELHVIKKGKDGVIFSY